MSQISKQLNKSVQPRWRSRDAEKRVEKTASDLAAFAATFGAFSIAAASAFIDFFSSRCDFLDCGFIVGVSSNTYEVGVI